MAEDEAASRWSIGLMVQELCVIWNPGSLLRTCVVLTVVTKTVLFCAVCKHAMFGAKLRSLD